MKAMFLLTSFLISAIMGYAIFLAISNQLSALNVLFNELGLDTEYSLLQEIMKYIEYFPYRPL